MESTKGLETYARTDVGLKREKNEDSFLIIDRTTELYDVERSGRMYALADGMGGHTGGEIASRLACQGLADYYLENISEGHRSSNKLRSKIQHIKSVFLKIHNQIKDYGVLNKEYEEMGTTLSVLVLLKGKALIAHVGDSRIYRLRRDVLEQLTVDHTFAQALLEKGIITSEEASSHPTRHVMTQAVGRGVESIFHKIEKVEPGDLFLLCSDGLYNMLSDIQIKDIIVKTPGVSEKCNRLVERALEMGGKYNVTVVVNQV